MRFDLFRGPGNRHFDTARILWALSCVAGIGYTGAHLVMNHAFSIIEFGTGMGVLLAGGGGAIAMKDVAVANAAATVAATPVEGDK